MRSDFRRPVYLERTGLTVQAWLICLIAALGTGIETCNGQFQNIAC